MRTTSIACVAALLALAGCSSSVPSGASNESLGVQESANVRPPPPPPPVLPPPSVFPDTFSVGPQQPSVSGAGGATLVSLFGVQVAVATPWEWAFGGNPTNDPSIASPHLTVGFGTPLDRTFVASCPIDPGVAAHTIIVTINGQSQSMAPNSKGVQFSLPVSTPSFQIWGDDTWAFTGCTFSKTS